jgi:hypothetical protein
MPKVTFSARSAKGRVRNVSGQPRLGQDEFRAAFADARPLGRLPGDKGDPLSLAAIGEVVQRTLRSSGGRPALEGADAVPMRVSLMHGDRAKIEIIASHVHPHTSPAKMVAVLCHLALSQRWPRFAYSFQSLKPRRARITGSGGANAGCVRRCVQASGQASA